MVLAAGWEAPQVATLIAALLALVASTVGAVISSGSSNRRWLREVRHPAYAEFTEAARKFIDEAGATWVATPDVTGSELARWKEYATEAYQERLLPPEAEVERALGHVEVLGGEVVRQMAVDFANCVSDFTDALMVFKLEDAQLHKDNLLAYRQDFVEAARKDLGAVERPRVRPGTLRFKRRQK